MAEPAPVFVLTGFLGSGKTTLLRRFLRSPAGLGTGIVVNEFGETGVDHRLLVHATERIELLDGGCLCCTRRADIAQAMQTLVRRFRREGGFQRAVIETSGMADPTPIIATLVRDPWLRSHLLLRQVVAVVDAVAGPTNLLQHPEARRQVAVADMIVVTKTDLRAATLLPTLIRTLRDIAPDVPILDSGDPAFDPAALLDGTARRPPASLFKADDAPHSAGVGSFTLALPAPIDWPCFTLWLSALLHAHGDRILRVKGVLRTSSSSRPLVIHGVQHVMHPPTHLPADDGGPAFLVFITRGLERDTIAHSLKVFLAMGTADQSPRPAASSTWPTRSTAASSKGAPIT